ncbi:hypothetical protein ACE7GA_14770 [Roseomonas sp. CCTCC AB2023176]|uniref:hypothetical protein n=1 Tax=Roseomonas sp. CCTCC AB2023176 TaxID=3342640 RepID=UPI0035E07171
MSLPISSRRALLGLLAPPACAGLPATEGGRTPLAARLDLSAASLHGDFNGIPGPRRGMAVSVAPGRWRVLARPGARPRRLGRCRGAG